MKLVKCVVKNLETQKQQTRFIPLLEFNLWEHLLRNKHKIEVVEKQTIIWVDKEEYERKKNIYSKFFQEEVMKITLYLFSKEEEMLIPVIRFLSKEDYPELKAILLSHYQGQDTENLVEEEGYCVSIDDKLLKIGTR